MNGFRSRERRSRSRSRTRTEPDRPQGKPSNVLSVFGLGMHTNERDVKDAFSKHGRVTDVKIIYDGKVFKRFSTSNISIHIFMYLTDRSIKRIWIYLFQ